MKLELNHFAGKNSGKETPILFVHGMAHAAWCWEWKFIPYFTALGYDCYTLSLRGHGSSDGGENLRWWRIADYLNDVEWAINKIGGKPIVVAHSMGGFILQKYLLKSPNIKAAVTLSSVPANGMLLGSIKTARYFPWKFIKGNLTLSTAPFSETEYAVKTLCFSDDISHKMLVDTKANLQSESYMAYLDMLFLNLHAPKKTSTPTLFLRGANDFIVDEKNWQKTANGFGAESENIQEVAHDMMLDTKWEIVAEKIEKWLRKFES